MKKVRTTVLKTTLDKELAAEYGAEGLGPCPTERRRSSSITATGSGSPAPPSAAATTACAR